MSIAGPLQSLEGVMLDSWESDGGYPAQQSVAPSAKHVEWSQLLNAKIAARDNLASSMLTLSQLAGHLRPLSEETKLLLRPLQYLWDGDCVRIGIFSNLKTFTCEPINIDKDGNISPALGIDGNPKRWDDRIPASRIDDKGRILAPATDFTVIVLASIWGDSRIVFADQAAKDVYNALSMQWSLYFACAEMQANYKIHGHLSPLALSFPDPYLFNPKAYTPDGEPIKIAPYQRCAAACAAIVPGYNLWMKPGTGKSLTTIVAMDYLSRRHRFIEQQRLAEDAAYITRPFRVFITCPKGVRINWLEEIDKFSTVKTKALIYQGDSLTRTKRIIDATISDSTICDPENGVDTFVLVSSFGLMRNDYRKLTIPTSRKFKDIQIAEPFFDLGVIDEAHYIMNRKAKQTQHALLFRDGCARRMGLTGTQMPNGISDMYPQLEWIGEGFSGFQSQKQYDKFFKNRIEVPTENGPNQEIEIGVVNAPIIQERISRMAFTISKEEALPNLPKKRYAVRGVTMTPEQSAVYKKVLKAIEIQAEKELGGVAEDGRNYTMVVQNVLKKLLRLTQITSGFYVSDNIFDDDGRLLKASEVHRFDPNPKLEELMLELRDMPRTSKAIVAACWKQDIRTISARMNLEGIEHVLYYGPIAEKQRQENLHRFNTDKSIKVLLGNPSTFGIGRNINGQADDETNCDLTCIFSQTASSSVREQLEDRNNRLGTRVSGLYLDFMVYGTTDQEFRELVLGKRTNQLQISDVRSLLGRLSASLTTLRIDN